MVDFSSPQNIDRRLPSHGSYHYRHQRFPVSEINREVGLGQGRSTLFDVNLSFENHDNDMRFGDTEGHTCCDPKWQCVLLMS